MDMTAARPPRRPDRATRGPAIVLVAIAAAAIGLWACVPEPPGRATASPGAEVVATPTETPIPTPTGPTPVPTFVRPTPTPQPSFLIYTVVKGDNLTRIANRFHTTKESISYWNRAHYPSLDPDSPQYKPDDVKLGWTLQIIPNHVVDPENLPTLPPSPGQSVDTGASPSTY